MIKFVRHQKNWKTFDQIELEQALEYLKQELRLSDTDSNGASQREHLEAVERQTGKTPKELQNLLGLPEALREVWVWYKRLSNRRQSGMGINPITFMEMQAFFFLSGITPTPEEVKALEYFDNVSCSHYNKKQAEEHKKAKQQAQKPKR